VTNNKRVRTDRDILLEAAQNGGIAAIQKWHQMPLRPFYFFKFLHAHVIDSFSNIDLRTAKKAEAKIATFPDGT